MSHFLITVLIYIVGLVLTGFLTIGLLKIWALIKRKSSGMDDLDWRIYCKKVSDDTIVYRFSIMYLISLLIFAVIGYFIFKTMEYPHAVICAVIFIGIGCFYVFTRYMHNTDALIEKVNRLNKKNSNK